MGLRCRTVDGGLADRRWGLLHLDFTPPPPGGERDTPASLKDPPGPNDVNPRNDPLSPRNDPKNSSSRAATPTRKDQISALADRSRDLRRLVRAGPAPGEGGPWRWWTDRGHGRLEGSHAPTPSGARRLIILNAPCRVMPSSRSASRDPRRHTPEQGPATAR